ncbi:nucleotidyltransferase [Rossellomorea aquimaris]|uniref:nucleotidyltransferase n=1 Tax=Rossellomorea aquimaris TaxID=189382 RepID=UPI001CD3D00D|nr:nucleotidyltransferase [Rossellomorea aquimaris]MCA1053401.1 nucleotidyltransferase [Rossellomorea aquimaris]
MKATGVVVEYNPFHNGHLHHLNETRKTSGADLVIACMSGHFLQRGEPALVSKWARTEMALSSGVDMVIELPYAFATQHAEVFARGAISLLNEIGCESFCFGSEDGDISSFENTVSLIRQQNREYNDSIKRYMNEGMSYPSALSHAFKDLQADKELIDLSKPNNILGYHYVEARNDIASDLHAYTISRESAGYHDEHFSSPSIASATSIRKSLFSQEREDGVIDQYIPHSTLCTLENYKETFGDYHRWENYWALLQYKILSSSPTRLRDIYEIEEGIEYRMIESAKAALSFSDFMGMLKTKRYTWTRLQRMCLHILTNTTKEEMIKQHSTPSYIRLLGMNPKGQAFLNARKKVLNLPLISKLSSADQQAISLDIKASEVYSLGLPSPSARKQLLQQEWSQPPIISK